MPNHLKALRLARKMSRHAFARLMEVNPTTVWRWEQSTEAIPTRDIKRIATKLNVYASDIDPALAPIPVGTQED
jgi:transcriptional regulator with XRE-family HTH domain